MAGKKLVGVDGLTEFSGDITDTDLNLYVVDESNTSLDSEGSGFRMLIHKNFVVTDGTNPVQITGGGTIVLGGETLTITPGTGGDLVTTAGEQDITNKNFLLVDGEVGPTWESRSSDFWLYRSTAAPNNGRMRFGAGYLDNVVDHVFHVPNNDGQSILVDDETSQTVSNKTIVDPTIHVDDGKLILYQDGVSTGTINTGDRARLVFHADYTGFHDYVLPPITPSSSEIIVADGAQTMSDKVMNGGYIRVTDNQFALYDTAFTEVGVGRRAKFEIGGSGDEEITYTLPDPGDTGDTLAIVNGTQTLVNKTLTSPAINTPTIIGGAIDVQDSAFVIYDSAVAEVDSGRRAKFEINGTGDELITYGLPDPGVTSTNLVDELATQSLSGKTLTGADGVKVTRQAQTISGANSIVATQPFHILSASAGTTDNLDDIYYEVDGSVLFLSAANGHVITIRNIGNIIMPGTTTSVSLSHKQVAMLVFRSDISKWAFVGFGI